MNLPESENGLLRLFEICDSSCASDIHVAADEPVFLRVGGELNATSHVVDGEQLDRIVTQLIGDSGRKLYAERGSFDGAVGVSGQGDSFHRYRFNIFHTSGKTSIAFRKLESEFRQLNELGLPEQLYDVTQSRDGLVLVAGPTGSGKSTTLATLIDHINQNRPAHIVTIEDPVEYIHRSAKSRITHRQVGVDTPNFNQAVFDAVRQDPDIVLVGELRDLETINNAIEVAMTGHLVFATVHAGDTVGAIERVVNVFPGDQQPLIQQLLSSSLKAIVAQHLLPSCEPGIERVLASEVLFQTTAVSNLIRTSKVAQIRSVLETSASEGMYTLDSCLARLVQARKITPTTARSLARNPKFLSELPRAV